MNLKRGEIVLIETPFHQGQGAKIRPAVVVLDAADEDFVGAPVTSRPRSGVYELPVRGWHAAGLNAPSTIRVHKIAVLPKVAVRRSIGVLTPDDHTALQVALCRAFCPTAL